MSALPAALDELLDPDERDLVRSRRHPREVAVTLATLEHDELPLGDWLLERKLDGVRLVLHRDGDDVALWTRNHERRDGNFPEIAEALASLDIDDVVLDGEVVAFDGGVTSFQRLQGRMGLSDPDAARATGIAVHCYLFDILHLDGHDLTALPLGTRKRILKAVIAFEDPLRFTPHRVGDPVERLDDACRRGWEGLIAKRRDSAYPGSRTKDWRKLKCEGRQELVIGGFTEPQGERTGFGALLVGVHDDGSLRYAGKVGTGYDHATLAELRDRLDDLEVEDPPFEDPPTGTGIHWVRPELVGEVAFTEWTRGGKLRHPRFLGLRHDKDASDVVRE